MTHNENQFKRFQTKEELKEYYLEHQLVGNDLKRTVHRDFKDDLKKHFSFIGYMKGRKEASVYLHALANDIYEPPECVVCGEKIKTAHSHEFPKTCSRKCNGIYTSEVSKQQYREKHGVDHHTQLPEWWEKTQKIYMENWGVSHPMKSSEGKELQRQAVKKSLGVDNPFQSEEIKEKIKQVHLYTRGVDNARKDPLVIEKGKQTHISKRGVDNPMKDKNIRKQASETCVERYGAEHYTHTDEYKERTNERFNSMEYRKNHSRLKHISEETFEILNSKDNMSFYYENYGVLETSKILGVDGSTIYDWLAYHNIERDQSESSLEKTFEHFIKTLGVNYRKRDRYIISPYEIDFYFPDHEIGVELNGVYYHSTAKLDRNYHLRKTEMVEDAGVRLIHIFEDEWNYNREVCKKKIASILNKDGSPSVYARKCNVFKTTKTNQFKNFFEDNHIQGFSGATEAIFLCYDGVPVAVSLYKKRNNEEYEMVRYATSCKVPGGFSKLFKEAKNHYTKKGVKRIITFADRTWSQGKVYLDTGWKLDKTIKPDYRYVVQDRRVRKQNFRRNLLERKLENFDPELSEVENMLNHGYYQIFDCGLYKFTYDL